MQRAAVSGSAVSGRRVAGVGNTSRLVHGRTARRPELLAPGT